MAPPPPWFGSAVTPWYSAGVLRCVERSWGMLALAVVGAACRGTPATRTSTITIGIQQEPDTLFVPFKEMIAAEEVLRAGAVTLTVFDDHWRLVPSAAEDIPTLENGGLVLAPGGRMVATWRIRGDLAWADGTRVTADDFVLHQRLIADPLQEIADRSHVDMLESVEAAGADRLTLRATWKRPYAYHAEYRTFEAVPRHVVEKLWKDQGAALKQAAFGSSPLLAGAFAFEAWEKGQHVSLVRNPHAPARLKAHADRLVWRIVPSTSGLETALVSGSVDALSPVGLQLDQALDLQRRHGDRFDFHHTPGLSWEHIDFNLDDPWLADVRMRRALTMAIDRAGMMANLFAGRQEVAHTFTSPRRYDFEPAARQHAFDPAASAALLDDMGFRPGTDGIRERDGKRLSLTLTTTAGLATRERIAQVIQADLRKVGVELVVEMVPARVLFGELTRHRRFRHMVLFAWAFDPLKGPENYFACDAIPSEKNAWNGQNYGGWCDVAATALMRRAAGELDPAKRATILREVQRAWAEALPAIPLHFRTDTSITRKGFTGWRPTGTLTPVTWNAHEWRLP